MIEQEDWGCTSILRMVAGRGNALNIDFIEGLSAALAKSERGPARAVVLIGQGTIFGAGVDLPAIVAGGADYVRRFIPAMLLLFEQLARFPKPLIAAVNGHAIAGGAIVMLACDQRLLANTNARIGLTEILVGVEFPAWALEIARFATPAQHFPTIVCTGRTYLPQEALARGLVDELVEPDALLERAVQVAAEMGAIAPNVFAATKLAVREPLFEAVRREAARRDAAVLEEWCSAAAMQRIAEFAARNIGRRG